MTRFMACGCKYFILPFPQQQKTKVVHHTQSAKYRSNRNDHRIESGNAMWCGGVASSDGAMASSGGMVWPACSAKPPHWHDTAAPCPTKPPHRPTKPPHRAARRSHVPHRAAAAAAATSTIFAYCRLVAASIFPCAAIFKELPLSATCESISEEPAACDMNDSILTGLSLIQIPCPDV